MKINRLDKNAVRSTDKADRKVTTLSEQELKSVIGGELDCNCQYKYGSASLSSLA